MIMHYVKHDYLDKFDVNSPTDSNKILQCEVINGRLCFKIVFHMNNKIYT